MPQKPKQVMTPEKRRDYIVQNGAELAGVIGLNNVTPKLVSSVCKINTSVSTIRFYFKSGEKLREAIAKSGHASDDVKSQSVS